MTTANAISKLDLLLDKYGSPYFEESEKLEFLNMASLEVLNKMVSDSLGGVVNFEMDSNTLYNLKQLILPINVTIPAGGRITNTVLVAGIQAGTGDTTASVFRILNFALILNGVETSVKFVKHNVRFASNVFKTSSITQPGYIIEADDIRVLPITNFEGNSGIVTVMKTPRIMTAGNSPDWDDYVMNQVILQAVKLAGVPLRDEELQQDVRLTGFQSAQ